MRQYFFQRSTDKAQVIVFGDKEERLKVISQLKLINLKTADRAMNVGVVMYPDLNLNSHIKAFTKSSPYQHLKHQGTDVSAGLRNTCPCIYLQILQLF